MPERNEIKKYLFTTLPSNDLGLLTRSLPIAREIAQKGNEIVFCSPGKAPSKLIAEAGFINILPDHPIYHLLTIEPNITGFYHYFRSKLFKDNFGNLPTFITRLIKSIPVKMPPATSEIWDMDHFSAFTGMMNKNYVQSIVHSLMALMAAENIDVVVDFWNPMACIAARALDIPLVTVIQADMHPNSGGFIWWKEHPLDIPSPVPVINELLTELSINPINKLGEICLGNLTLVVGMSETDPLPPEVDVTYIGPVLWQRENVRMPEWFYHLNKDKPVVWVYSGNPKYLVGVRTPVDSEIILSACIAALTDEDIQVVLTTGHHNLPKEYSPLPSNFIFSHFVPGLDMAKRSDLLIHHGGYGSCQTGLYTGTPAVIIPTFSERESNARRVVNIGAGEIVFPTKGRSKEKQIDINNLRMTIRKVLSGVSYTVNARKASEKLRTFERAVSAADLIVRISQDG